jgi:hypothetical protein
MMRRLLGTDESRALQDQMASVIEAVRKVLSVPEERLRVLDRAVGFAKRFVMEIGPTGIATPRHADGPLPPLAIQLCHVIPLAMLETRITLKREWLFWAGICANVADGPMISIFSTNHQVQGWSLAQLMHGFIKHLMGYGCLPGIGQGFDGYGLHPPLVISNGSVAAWSVWLLVDFQPEQCDPPSLVPDGLETKQSRRLARRAAAKLKGVAAASAMLHSAVDSSLKMEPEHRSITAMVRTRMVSFLYVVCSCGCGCVGGVGGSVVLCRLCVAGSRTG